MHLYCLYTLFPSPPFYYFFFFNDTATTEIYTLSLHDALPILSACDPPILLILEVRARRPEPGRPAPLLDRRVVARRAAPAAARDRSGGRTKADRKSTRLNSSHMSISYAVFCLKKKKKKHTNMC